MRERGRERVLFYAGQTYDPRFGLQHLWAILLSLSDCEFICLLSRSPSLSHWLSGSAKKFIKNFYFDVSEFYFKVFSLFSLVPTESSYIPRISGSMRSRCFIYVYEMTLPCPLAHSQLFSYLRNYGKFPRCIFLWPDKSLMREL